MNQKRTPEDFVLDEKFRRWVLAPDEESNQYWEEWQKQNPHLQKALKQGRELLLNIPEIRYVYPQEQEDRVWNSIKRKAQQKENPAANREVVPMHPNAKANRKGNVKRIRFDYLRGGVAASLIILLSFISVYLWHKFRATKEAAEPHWVVKENPFGQRSTIYLSDGSEVILNAGSRLRYLENFQADKRIVFLEGEAFFSVAKNPDKPFEVISGNIITRAVGTSFNVKAYPHEAVHVALVTGKVQVRKNDQHSQDSLWLLPGERARCNPEQPGQLIKENYDAKKVLSWKDGKLYFEDADEKTVFTTLERWYGVKIHTVNASPKKWSYTAEAKNISLDLFLNSLSFSMDFSYEIKNKEVTIKYNN